MRFTINISVTSTIIVLSILKFISIKCDTIDNLNAFIDANQHNLFNRLRDAISIKSVSSQSEFRNDTIYMTTWMANEMRKLNISVQLIDIGFENQTSGQQLPLPPVLIGELISRNSTQKKKTLCVYGHLDVQPAKISDGWNSDPFIMTRVNGSLIGRGTSDDKGPVVGWLNAIHAYQQSGIELPVNIKFIFEAMEETGSVGLENVLRNISKSFLSDIDYVAINDDIWISNTKPSLKYAQRGMIKFEVEVRCADKDLHSGIYGGVVREVMTDLIVILGNLVHANGTVLIPGFMDDVRKISPDDIRQYGTLSFSEQELRRDIGANHLNYRDKVSTLLHLWRFPSLSIHGFEGMFGDSGFKSVIPAKAIAKFSIRTVPNQRGKNVQKLVTDYLYQTWVNQLTDYSPNNFTVRSAVAGEPWITNPESSNFIAARRAVRRIYDIEPDLAMTGATDPITTTLEEVTNATIVLLSMGRANSGMHSQNENIDIINYINGTKLMAAYMYELSLM